MWNKFSTKLYKWASDNQAITTSSWYTFYTPKTLLNNNRPWRLVPRTQPLTPPWSMRSPKRNQLWTSSLLWFNQDIKKRCWSLENNYGPLPAAPNHNTDPWHPHPPPRLHRSPKKSIETSPLLPQPHQATKHNVPAIFQVNPPHHNHDPFLPLMAAEMSQWRTRRMETRRDEWRQDKTKTISKKKLSRWETRRMEMRRDENKMRQLVKKKIVTMGDETNGDKTRRMETRRMETKRMETRRIETRRMETRRMETRRKELRGLSSDDVERDSANHDAATCDDSDRDEESRCDICLDNMTKDDSAKIIFMIN